MANVLVLYQYYCTPQGSWGTRYYEFARRWVQAGHDVTIVTSCYDKSDLRPRGLVSKTRIDGATIITFNIRLSNHHGKIRRLCTFAAYAILCVAYGLRLPLDTLVVSSGPLTVAIPGLIVRALRRVRLVFEVRDVLPDTAVALGGLRSRLGIAIARGLARLTYRMADDVVALSPDMGARVTAEEPRARVTVIPNAADLDLFVPAEDTTVRGRFTVLYAGTLGPANDVLEIAGIAAELLRRKMHDVRIVVIGDGRERASLEHAIEARALVNVELLGILPKTLVAQWHKEADVALLTFADKVPLAWSSPNKLFDAFAAGIPVLNNTQGWIRALLLRADCGFTFASGNHAHAVDAIQALQENPARARAMGERARQLAESEFSRDMLSHKFCGLLGARSG